MIIEICKKIIELNLLNIDEFKNLKKYESFKTPEYIISSKIGKIIIPNEKKCFESKFYDLYLDGLVQIQKYEGKIIGRIDYGKETIITIEKSSFSLEYLLTQYVLVHIIESDENTIFMHGSSIKYKNSGIIFTAASGVGKSTHVRLWTSNSDAININDDKNIISLEDEKLYLYPNPWSGKHQIDNNIKSSLDAIVFIERGINNEVSLINKKEAFIKLLPQLIYPTKQNINKWNKLVDKMLDLKLYKLKCNMDIEAFKTINKKIEEDLYETK